MFARELLNSALTGRAVRNGKLTDLPSTIVREQNRASKNALKHSKDLSVALEAYSIALRNITGKVEGNALEMAMYAVVEEELYSIASRLALTQEHEEDNGDDALHMFALTFYTARGFEPALDFLMREFFPSPIAQRMRSAAAADRKKRAPVRDWERRMAVVACAIMNVLKDLCYAVEDFADMMGKRDDLISELLRCLDHDFASVAEMCALLCEDVLVGRRDSVFDLRKTSPGFISHVIPSWSALQLLLFCRLVSLLITEVDDRNMNATGAQLKAFDLLHLRRRVYLAELSGKDDVVAINQLLLLEDCPEFVPRLVQLLEEPANAASARKLWMGRSNKGWRRVSSPAPVASAEHSVEGGGGGGLSFFSQAITHLLESLCNKVRNTQLSTPEQDSPRAVALMESAALLVPEEDVLAAGGGSDEDSSFYEDEDYDEDYEDEDAAFHRVGTFWDNAVQRDMWLLSQRLEVAHVLCSFCVGPHKKLVQDRLKQLNLVSALVDRFDLLVWDPSFKSELTTSHFALHGGNCECNPQQTFKIQLLRLVHNFCDRESDNKSNKLQLFSPQEREATQSWNPDTMSRPGVMMTPAHSKYWSKIDLNFPPKLPATVTDINMLRADSEVRSKFLGLPSPPHHDRGLAWRIAAALLLGNGGAAAGDEDRDDSTRFWERSALEALLRGSSLVSKLMVCSWGVLHYLVNLILSPGEKKEGQLQTSFDLLAELVKDNCVALAWLCGDPTAAEVLGEQLPYEHCLAQLCDVAKLHLVESNVFIRSVLLTAHRSSAAAAPLTLVRECAAQHLEFAPLMGKLFTIVQLEEVSQENMCCLNTAVVLCTVARREGKLLNMIREAKLMGERGADINFRKLLWYWRCYYSCRALDRSAIELSTGIKFEELDETVRLLGQPGVLLDEGVVAKVEYLGDAMPVEAIAASVAAPKVVAWGEL